MLPCERGHCGLRWSSLWGGGDPHGATKRVRGVPTSVRWRHASSAAAAFGGAPYEATKRANGVPRWPRWRHANATANAFE
eukprot:2544793-Pyramimonas_sp.AAC.1